MQSRLMLIAICIGAFMSHYTAGVVNVSLPAIAREFAADARLAQWVTTGYLLTIAALLPLMGKLADRIGHRRLHNAGYILFGISSLLTALAPGLAVLVALRVIQAVGAAMFQASNMALIVLHTPPDRRGRALGVMSTAVALGGLSGPVAGGVIAQWLSWQWLFLSHVPAAAVAVLLALRHIPQDRLKREQSPLGWRGALVFTVAIGLTVAGLSALGSGGEQLHLPLLLLGGAAVTWLALLLNERRASTPFLPVRLLRIRGVAAGLILSTGVFMLSNMVLVALPFDLAVAGVLSSLAIGTVMAAYPLLLAIAAPVAGRMADRGRTRSALLLGLAVMGLSFAAMALLWQTIPPYGVAALLGVLGAGMGLVTSPNNGFIMGHVPRSEAGTTGSLVALTRNAGMVLGAALGLGASRVDVGTTATSHMPALQWLLAAGVVLSILLLLLLKLWGFTAPAQRSE